MIRRFGHAWPYVNCGNAAEDSSIPSVGLPVLGQLCLDTEWFFISLILFFWSINLEKINRLFNMLDILHLIVDIAVSTLVMANKI